MTEAIIRRIPAARFIFDPQPILARYGANCARTLWRPKRSPGKHCMRILYLNHYAGSPAHGMEFRPFYLAREWVRAGHQVRIVAASFSHVRAHQPVSPDRDSSAWNETISGIDYTWIRTPAYTGNGIGRVRNIFSFLWSVWKRRKFLIAEKPDVVIASSTYPMDIWVAKRLARAARAKTVFEVHDLWPLSPIELGGMSPGHPFIRLCQSAENFAYRNSDAVVSMLPCVNDYMEERGLQKGRLHIIPNGIDPEEWEGNPIPPPADLIARLSEMRTTGKTIVGYAGSHGTPNALDVLLDAAAEMKHEPFAFVLVGNGHEKPRLLSRATSEALENVLMWPPIAKSSIPAFLDCIDIAYLGWQKIPLYRFGISPNKLMDYMMAARPILHSVEAGNDPVAEAGCGLTVQPMDAGAIIAGLHSLAALSPEERSAMGERGRAYALAHHAYPVLARRFLEAMAA